ncbi:MAG: hypothetical protein AB9869_31290 [Verrucomicrobiia bacterium]
MKRTGRSLALAVLGVLLICGFGAVLWSRSWRSHWGGIANLLGVQGKGWLPSAVRAYGGLRAHCPSLEEYPLWLQWQVRRQPWETHPGYQRQLTRETLEESLRLGRIFLVHNQKPAGNFNYSYDFVAQKLERADNAVRQAGALWGVSLLFHHQPTDELRRSLELGFDFFLRQTVPGNVKDSLAIAYAGDLECKSGTVALTALAIIEYLRTAKDGPAKLPDARRQQLERTLDGYLRHLESMRLANRHFSDSWSLERNTKGAIWNPYSDGEILLCFIKAAKYLDYSGLVPLIEDTALELAKSYTTDQWRFAPDSDLTKGFFQWSCMAFWEYRDTGWKHASMADDYLLVLAWWMVHVHGVLQRGRNTGYAFEGILPAFAAARERGDEAAHADLGWAIDQGLAKLTSWQVGGPLWQQNPFLRSHPTDDPLALGGVLNASNEASLRIDVAQHQMHAVLQALRHVYTDKSNNHH